MGFQSNFSLGICNVNYNGIDLGETKGLVDVTIKENTVAKKDVLPFGNTPTESYDTGIEISVDVPLAEYTLDNIGVALPKSAARSDRRTVGGWLNDNNILTPGKLILIPAIVNNTTDVPLTIYKAVVTAIKPITWEINIKVLGITFTGQIDETRPVNDQLFRIGGPSS